MKSASKVILAFGLLLNMKAWSASETKLTCSEVAATEAKCLEYKTLGTACEAEVDAGIKAKTAAAKKDYDDCKKKYSFEHVIKCKKELKNSTAAIHAPKQLTAQPIQKELDAKPDSSCAKANAIASSTAICKGPKAALDVLKRNCIKDAAP